MEFINRHQELEALERALATPPALFILYGRRRVGKTALLHRVCSERRHVFFTADLGSRSDQLASFVTVLARDLGEDELAGLSFLGWEEAFRYLIARARTEPLTLVLDEFQHMVTADSSLASVLQRLWDKEIAESQLSLVLCGSYVGFMEREVLGIKNPLFGRRTGQLLLRPLHFRDAGLFFPDWSSEDRMSALGVLGGIPAYLRQFDPALDVAANVRRAVLNLGAPLMEEPRFLLMEELREPQTYFSLCRAMAHGHGRPNEIAQAAGLGERANPAAYLASLREMHLVERRVPVTQRNPERSRRGLYRLADPFLRFWFRFVLPHRTALEAGDAELVWQRKIEPHLAQHVAVAFEDASREHLLELNRRQELPAVYDRIGGWWRGPEEVDVVAVADDGPLLLAECKWSRRVVGVDVLRNLEQKSSAVQADLKRSVTRTDLALFSRSGFTADLKSQAGSRDDLLLVSVDEVLR